MRDRVAASRSERIRITTSDAELARAFNEIPQIAALRRADGTLDVEAYKALVGSQGMTPESFEASMRRDLAVDQVLGNVAGTAFASKAQANIALDALFQRREIQTVENQSGRLR